MARLSRYTQKLFASLAGSNQIAKYGSLAAGVPARTDGSTITPAFIQSLSNYLVGWFDAVEGLNAPAIEDMNALCYLFSYQLANIFQDGVPLYDASTTYFIGSVVQYSGAYYASKTNTNLGNTPSIGANWQYMAQASVSGADPSGHSYLTGTTIQAQLDEADVQLATNTPPGIISAFGGAAAPTGWLLCDGSSVLRATYPSLFSAIGTAYGTADGTHFNVPDLRGRFLRGTDGIAGRDPDSASRTAMNAGGNTGDNVGSVQTDAFQGHWHEYNYSAVAVATTTGSTSDDLNQPTAPGGPRQNRVTDAYDDGTHGVPRVSTETRPLNAYVNYIIKF